MTPDDIMNHPKMKDFLMTWGSACGAPFRVFEGQLRATLAEVLAQPGQRVLLLLQRITREIPVSPRLVANPGTYAADAYQVSSRGAVSVLATAPDGSSGWLGVKPGEFRWLEVSE